MNTLETFHQSFDIIVQHTDKPHTVNVSATKRLSVFDYSSEIENEIGVKINNFFGEIEFYSASFQYTSMDDFAMNGISFKSPEGKRPRSSAKAAVESRLCWRFYLPTDRKMLIDGNNVLLSMKHSDGTKQKYDNPR
jgi:hypothetical protein